MIEGMATHLSVLAWKIPWTEELAGYDLQGRKESDKTKATEHTVPVSCIKLNNIKS